MSIPWDESKWTPEQIKALYDLADQAEREGLFLWTSYQDIWFSPSAIRAAWEEGRFRWGAINWSLRDPKEKLAEIKASIGRRIEEYDALADKVGVTHYADHD